MSAQRLKLRECISNRSKWVAVTVVSTAVYTTYRVTQKSKPSTTEISTDRIKACQCD